MENVEGIEEAAAEEHDEMFDGEVTMGSDADGDESANGKEDAMAVSDIPECTTSLKEEVSALNFIEKEDGVTVVVSEEKDLRFRDKHPRNAAERSNLFLKKPFRFGWRRELVYRAISNSSRFNNMADVYYVAPDGAKLRSSREIRTHLQCMKDTKLSVECFSFTKETIHCPPHELVRNANLRPRLLLSKLTKLPSTHRRTRRNIKLPRKLADQIDPEFSPNTLLTKKQKLKSPKQNLRKKSLKALSDDSSPEKRKKSLNESSDMSILKPKVQQKPQQQQQQSVRCSIDCPGRETVVPSLHCGICLCLFHPACVGLSEERHRDFLFICQECQIKIKKNINLYSPNEKGGAMQLRSAKRTGVTKSSRELTSEKIYTEENHKLDSTPKHSFKISVVPPCNPPLTQVTYPPSKPVGVSILKPLTPYHKSSGSTSSTGVNDASFSSTESSPCLKLLPTLKATPITQQTSHSDAVPTSNVEFILIPTSTVTQSQSAFVVSKSGASATTVSSSSSTAAFTVPQIVHVGNLMQQSSGMTGGSPPFVVHALQPSSPLQLSQVKPTVVSSSQNFITTSKGNVQYIVSPSNMSGVVQVVGPTPGLLATIGPPAPHVTTSSSVQLKTHSPHSSSPMVFVKQENQTTAMLIPQDNSPKPRALCTSSMPTIIHVPRPTPSMLATSTFTLAPTQATQPGVSLINKLPISYVGTPKPFSAVLPSSASGVLKLNRNNECLPGKAITIPLAACEVLPTRCSERLAIKRELKEKQAQPNPTLCFMSNLHAGFDSLIHIFSYLDVKSLSVAARVCRTWRQVASHSCVWRSVSLRNTQIADWIEFARRARLHNTSRLDLRGMIMLKDKSRTWHGFASILNDLRQLKHVDFGEVPTFILHIVASNLLELKVLNVEGAVEDNSSSESSNCCRLDIGKFGQLSKLSVLRLHSFQGLHLPSFSLSGGLSNLESLSHLRHLTLTSLKNIPSTEFKFLSSLKHLISLELGDCCMWYHELHIILRELKNLTRLRLEGKTHIGDDDTTLLEALNPLTRLQHLELILLPIPTNFGLTLQKLECLRKLVLWTPNKAFCCNGNILCSLKGMDSLKELLYGVVLPKINSEDLPDSSTKSLKMDQFMECILFNSDLLMKAGVVSVVKRNYGHISGSSSQSVSPSVLVSCLRNILPKTTVRVVVSPLVVNIGREL